MITTDFHGILGYDCPICKKRNMVVLNSIQKGTWMTGDPNTCEHFKGLNSTMNGFLFKETATEGTDNGCNSN